MNNNSVITESTRSTLWYDIIEKVVYFVLTYVN